MNAYQIQEHCFDFCKEKLVEKLQETDKESYEKISAVAFDDGIEMETVTQVISIKLRDMVLSLHGKAHTEIDHHSPE